MANPNSLDLRMAVAALDSAPDRPQIFGLVLRGARTAAPYAALISVHAAGLRGQKAVGDGRFDCEIISGIRLPRAKVPVFEEVIASQFPYVGPIATGDASVDLQLRHLGGLMPDNALILPLVVRHKTMVLLIAHAGGEGELTMDDASALYPLLAASGRALERFAAVRTDAAASQPGRVSATTTAVLDVPDEATALRGAVTTHRNAHAWPDLSEALRALVRLGVENGDPNEAEQLELLLELGGVEDYLDHPELAIEAWRSALTIDAGDRRVLESLERLFARRGLWSEFVELLERRAALAEDPRERIGLLLNAASFCKERLQDEARAVEAYERIVAFKPGHPVATARLEELYRSRAQWPELAALLVDQAARQEDLRLCVAALEEAAEIYETKIEDAGAAFLVWVAVIRREPDRTGLIDALERLGPAASAWDDILPECEGLAEELTGEQPATAARLWQQIGRWYQGPLENPEQAAAALDRAHRLEPDDLTTARELVELRRTVGPPEELARLLEKVIPSEEDRAARTSMLIELAGILENKLDQATPAIAHLERALDEDPGSRTAANELRRLHRARGEWNALASVLTTHAAAVGVDATPAEVAELHRELGDVLAGHLSRPEQAARAFKTAIDLDPDNTGAFQGLKEIHRSSGHREGYLEIEEAELAGLKAPDLARYATLAEEWEAIASFDRAAAVWRKVIDQHPGRTAAHAGLARVLRKQGRWDALVTACRAHLAVLEGAARAPVLLDLSSALETGLDDVEGAIKACEEALKLAPDNAAAQETLPRLYEQHGRLNEALAALERRAAAGTASEKERADLQQRMGHIHANRGEASQAIACFERALAADTRCAGAHEGLGRVHRNRADWTLATHHLSRAAELSTGADQVRCLMEAADIYWQRLSDPERARASLERALEVDRGNQRVRDVLCAILAEAGKWDALWPHMASMAERAASDAEMRPEARRDLLLRAARCAVEVGKAPRAIELCDQVLAMDAGDLTALLARADALFRGEQWEAASKAYNALLVQHDRDLERGQVAGVYRRLALTYKAMGKEGQATASYKKVLEADPTNRQTLEELVDLDIGRKRYEEAITTLRTLIGVVPQGERAAIFERIGDLYAEKLNNTVRAAATYEQVLEQDKRNHRVLQKLLDAQGAAGQWKEAVVTIGRFIELEAQPHRRAPYFMAAGTIRVEKLNDLPGAIEAYEHAIDAATEGTGALAASARTRALEALQALCALVAPQKDWKRQERGYRKIIKRLPMEEPALIELWHGLGEIYARMEDPESAIVAFETAFALDPARNPARVTLIADLYAVVGSSAEQDMVERASRLVGLAPGNPDALRALARACQDAGRTDEAWCVCRALVHLKQAKGPEEELYKKHQAQEQRRPSGVLDHDSWRFVRHADEDRVLSAIFAVLWEGPLALRAGPPKSFGLKDRDRLKPDDDRPIGKLFQEASRALATQMPSVYVQPDRSGKLMLANCIESKRVVPSLIVGRDIGSLSTGEVAFTAASMIALMRPAYVLRLALPTIDELEAVLAAAGTTVGKPLAWVRPEPAAAAVAFVPEIQKRLAPQGLETLAGLMARLPDKPDLAAWRNAVDVAGRRAGFLISGDLTAAAAVLSAEASLPGGPRAADKVRDLLLYSVSPDYFAARRHLGVAVA